MFKQFIKWLKNLFHGLFGAKKDTSRIAQVRENQPPPPLDDTDLEFLFTELLEGVYQARGQSWVLRWLANIEHRVPEQRWLEWLHKFGARLLASSSANNEIASRMVQLGELEVGPVGDTAYDLGMQLLTRNQPEPIWEYAGPDAIADNSDTSDNPYNLDNHTVSGADFVSNPQQFPDANQSKVAPADGKYQPQAGESQSEEGEYQTITIEQLFELLQQDPSLRQNIAQQLGVETDDPEIIIQAVVNQLEVVAADTGDSVPE